MAESSFRCTDGCLAGVDCCASGQAEAASVKSGPGGALAFVKFEEECIDESAVVMGVFVAVSAVVVLLLRAAFACFFLFSLTHCLSLPTNGVTR